MIVREKYSITMHFTRDPVDTETLQPADINNRQQFWLTVHVPDDTPAGIYKAPVKVIPKNAAARELTLEVTVPGFDLLPPRFEYSVYYPRELSPVKSYLNELRNMMAHGCTNPTIYAGPSLKDDGTLDFTNLDNILQRREMASSLYMVFCMLRF